MVARFETAHFRTSTAASPRFDDTVGVTAPGVRWAESAFLGAGFDRFVVLLLIASWFLAESYTIARDLWIDFDAWKRAVPVVGQKWADRDKKRKQQDKGN